MASATVLPAVTNHQVACRLLLTGDLIDAAEALELGLVLQVGRWEGRPAGAAAALPHGAAGGQRGASARLRARVCYG